MLGLRVKISRGGFIQFAINKCLSKKRVQMPREISTVICLGSVDELQRSGTPSGSKDLCNYWFWLGILGLFLLCTLQTVLRCVTEQSLKTGKLPHPSVRGSLLPDWRTKAFVLWFPATRDRDTWFSSKAKLTSSYPIKFCLTILCNVPLLLMHVCTREGSQTGFLDL